jgi:outer membrane receptor protein involved in Fe transport
MGKMRFGLKSALLQSAAGIAIALSCVSNVAAQDTAAAAEKPAEKAEEAKSPKPAEKVIVYGTVYRDRSNDTAPTLKYDLDFFQKFEPLTVGDALKRVPSATFQSDVLEYDGVRLRGLDPGYTQILINGEKVPGSGVDRSFFVDRIPAELIERVEIVRSSSADRSGDALAGAINIVLRDAYSLDGGYVKAGGLYFSDDDLKPTVGGVVGAPIGEARILLGANMQGRHNPKDKKSFRYAPEDGVLEFDNREDQSDVRDGTDYSFNASLVQPFLGGELDLSGVYVRTDRTETEHSLEYGDETSVDIADLNETADQFEDIFQENFTARAKLTVPLFGGEALVRVGYAGFKDDVVATEIGNEYEDGVLDPDEASGSREFTDQTDNEFFATLAQTFDYETFKFKFGADYTHKDRDTVILVAENDGGALFPPPEAEPGSVYGIEETRIDPYALLRGEIGMLRWEAGVRYETTELKVRDEDGTTDNDFSFLLPSAHALYSLTDDDRFRASVARTVRRPNFDYLAPALLEETPTEDLFFRGNPGLNPETAVGFDVSYERRLGRRGVVGVNFFYRDVQDRIELVYLGENVNIADPGDPPEELAVLTPGNIGDGKVWGLEFDLSTPLTFVGLEHTGVFANYSWLDSEIADPVTGEKRRFNDQAEYVFNVGVIQDVPSVDVSFGASYRKQGGQYHQVLGEIVETVYGADLEVFIEKRFGENFVLRLTGSNLLDASKDETFFKWETASDQTSGNINQLDEFEVESEKAGPVFQLVGRYAF